MRILPQKKSYIYRSRNLYQLFFKCLMPDFQSVTFKLFKIKELIGDYLKLLCSLVKCLKRQLFRDNQQLFLDCLKHSCLALTGVELTSHLKTPQGRSIYETFINLLLVIIKDSSKDSAPIFSDLNRLILNDLEKVLEFQSVF